MERPPLGCRWHQPQGPAWIAAAGKITAVIKQVVKDKGVLVIAGPSGCGKTKLIQHVLKSMGTTCELVVDEGNTYPSYTLSLYQDARARLLRMDGPGAVLFKYASELEPKQFASLIKLRRNRALIITEGPDYYTSLIHKDFVLKLPDRALCQPIVFLADGRHVQCTCATQSDADCANADGCPNRLSRDQPVKALGTTADRPLDEARDTDKVAVSNHYDYARMIQNNKRFFSADVGAARYVEQQAASRPALAEALSALDRLRYEGLVNFDTLLAHTLPLGIIQPGKLDEWDSSVARGVTLKKLSFANDIVGGHSVEGRSSLEVWSIERLGTGATKREKSQHNAKHALSYVAPKRLAPEPSVDVSILNATSGSAPKRARK